MNQLQFRGKLHEQVFLISTLENESSLCAAHVLHGPFPEQYHLTGNVFLDSTSDNQMEDWRHLEIFKDQFSFCPYFKEYKAPFGKQLMLRQFNKNGSLEDILSTNDELEEIYIGYIIKHCLGVLTFTHSVGLCELGIHPSQIEVNDEGTLCFPFYYHTRRLNTFRLVKELSRLQQLVSVLIGDKEFSFGDVDKSRFSNKFKDFLKSLFREYGFGKALVELESVAQLDTANKY